MNSRSQHKMRQPANDRVFAVPPPQFAAATTGPSTPTDWGMKVPFLPSLWRFSRGKDISIAVLDTGIDANHPDLEGALQEAKDFTGSKNGTFDYSGHGTHVAGIIAARDNSMGITGLSPECRLLVGKVLCDLGRGTARHVEEGIRWAMERKADIINLSTTTSMHFDFIHEAVKDAVNAGIHVICASGNIGPQLNTVEYPGQYPETITVGAVQKNRDIWKFSSRGPSVDFVAPGVDIESTFPMGLYVCKSGTSIAAPFVTGIAALILAKHRLFGGDTPVTGREQMVEHLKKIAADLGAEGFDEIYGHGLIVPGETANGETMEKQPPGTTKSGKK